jgi:hypothetical protein
MRADDESPGRALLVAFGAMAGVALLAGLAIGLVVLAVVKGAGVGDPQEAAQEAPQSLYMPEYSPTGELEDDLDLPSVSATPSPEGVASSSAEPDDEEITLFVTPQSVAPSERINFNGTYQGGEGIDLQIQRKEGETWADFPVTAPVRGGSFSTWIQTTRTGRSEFRVYDEQVDRASNVVVVNVG